MSVPMMNSGGSYPQNYSNSQNPQLGSYPMNMMPSNQQVQAPTPQGPQAANALGRFGGSNISVPMGQAPPGMSMPPQGRGGMNVNSNMAMNQGRPSSGMNITGTANMGPAPPPGLGNVQRSLPMGGPQTGLTPQQRAQQQHMMNGSANVSNQRPMPVQNYNNDIINMMNQSKGPVSYTQGNMSLLDRVNTPPAMTTTPPPQSPSKGMPSFDSEFPMIARGGMGPTMVPGLSKQNDQSQEFSLGSDDFPALPGFKASSNTDGSGLEDHHFAYRPQSNVNMQYSKATVNMMNPQMNSYMMGSSDTPLQRQQSANSLSSYEQFLPHLRQPQQQQQKKSFLPDRFGLLGLLSVIRMTDPDLNTLALGTDLTTLGLNLNSPECLYSTFASPWAEGPSRREPEYYIPMCYYMQSPLQSPILKMTLFSEETLFEIFYSMPRDLLQAAAAAELYKRDWRYHKEHKLWLTRVSGSESQKTATHERGSYVYFDPTTWEKVRKDNFVLAYDQIEIPPSISTTPPPSV